MTNDAGIPENGRERARPSVTRVISQATGPASLVEWAKLALDDPKAPVLRLARVRHDDRFGTLHEEIVLSLGHFPGLPADEPIPDIAELAHRCGLGLGKSTERICLVRVPGDVARHLGIALGTDVVKIDRVRETSDGEPVEWCVAYAWKAT